MPKFLQADIRRRPSLTEVTSEFNAWLTGQLIKVPNFWGPGKSASDALLETSGDVSSLDLRESLIDGLEGQIRYCPRFAGWVNLNTGMADDTMSLGFDSQKIDARGFYNLILPRLIEIFTPYRAAIKSDQAVVNADWKISCTMPQQTSRNSVYRIWPVCYFDELLCQRAFGFGAAEVVRRATPECERAEILCGGAFLVVTSETVMGQDLDVLNARVMKRLGDTPTQ